MNSITSCGVCGKEMSLIDKYGIIHKKKIYCSEKCREIAMRYNKHKKCPSCGIFKRVEDFKI